ncbi:type I-E CRISPR-associated protein Cas6/Cse3/CasE [bacterium]|nr:type I-E CRISPR-associated protein Cas6/Cse3/CasE [bacterium]
MQWLARLEIDTDRAMQEGMIDTYSWHKKLWQCFPDDPEATRDFLSRVDQLEGKLRFWISSERKPEKPNWCLPDRFEVKEIKSALLEHQYYTFDVRVNPAKRECIKRENNKTVINEKGKRIRGKRRAITKQGELKIWFERKAEEGGFRLIADKPLEISPVISNYFKKKNHEGFHGGAQFRGRLEIVDRDKFKETYAKGIGSAKGFGFGMLLIAPIKQ